MFPGFAQGIIVAVIVILAQTTKRVRGDDTGSSDDGSHVLALTKDTFEDAVKNNKHLLVKFVAPWCGHCKSLAPAYAAAAKQLADLESDIKLASVDATIEGDLAQQYEVKGYPTIKFFSDGTTFEYTGGRNQEEIVSWLKKKTGPAADELKTVEDLNKLTKASDVVVIGAFQVRPSISRSSLLFYAIALPLGYRWRGRSLVPSSSQDHGRDSIRHHVQQRRAQRTGSDKRHHRSIEEGSFLCLRKSIDRSIDLGRFSSTKVAMNSPRPLTKVQSETLFKPINFP